MTITTNARYDTQNARPDKSPVYAILIDGISDIFVLTAGAFVNSYTAGNTYKFVTDISASSRSVEPEQGRSTIGGMTITLLDFEDAVTPHLQNLTPYYQAQPRKVRIWGGYHDTDFGTLIANNDAPALFTGTIHEVSTTDNGLGYIIELLDLQILAFRDIFTDASDTNIVTLTGHPYDLLLQILTSTGGVGTVTVGTAGYIERSTNSINFYRQTSGAPAVALTGIAYGASKFVACNATNTNVYISTDGGVTWSTQAIGIANFYANKIRYFNGLFILVGSDGAGNGMLATSTDAITWTSRTVTSAAPLYDVAYGAGVWVAMGGDTTTVAAGKNNCFSSADGVTWTARTADGRAVVFGGTTFVSVGYVLTGSVYSNWTVYTSTDGITWTARTSPIATSTNSLASLAYYNSLYVAVGANGVIYTTANGIAWTARTSPVSGYNLNDVIWTGKRYFAVGNSGTLIYSLDGITWVDVTETPPDSATNFYASAYYTNVNGAYDVLPLEHGVGYDQSLINLASFTDNRDVWWVGGPLSIPQKAPVNAKSFIEDELLKIMNAYLIVQGDGKIALKVIHPPYVQSGVTPQTFDNDSIIGMPKWKARLPQVIDKVTFRYDYDVTNDKFWTVVDYYRASPIDKFGITKALVIESKGLKGANAALHGMTDLGGDGVASERASRIFQRWAQPAPLISCRTLFHKHINEEGDIVYLTHPKLPNRTLGTDGLTNEVVEITSKKVNWMAGYVDWELMTTNFTGLRYGVIAPDTTADYNVATALEKNTYAYICLDTGYMADGTLGYAIM